MEHQAEQVISLQNGNVTELKTMENTVPEAIIIQKTGKMVICLIQSSWQHSGKQISIMLHMIQISLN